MKDDSSETPVEKARPKKRADLVKESDKEKDLFCVRSCPFCFSGGGDWCDYDYIALSKCLHKLC